MSLTYFCSSGSSYTPISALICGSDSRPMPISCASLINVNSRRPVTGLVAQDTTNASRAASGTQDLRGLVRRVISLVRATDVPGIPRSGGSSRRRRHGPRTRARPGPWALGPGPWALGLGPWALGLGPWALGLGPWALGLWPLALG